MGARLSEFIISVYDFFLHPLVALPVIAYLIVRLVRKLGIEKRVSTIIAWAVFPLTASVIVLRIVGREIAPFGVWWLISVALLLGLLLLTFVLLITQIKKTVRSRVAVIALLLATFFFHEPGWLLSASNHRCFNRRAVALNAFVHEVQAYGKIHSMSDGLRYHKDLNGRLITYDEREENTRSSGRDVFYFAKVLEEDGVDGDRYEQFRSRLIDLGLMSFETTEGHIVLTIDGFLNKCHGLLYTAIGASKPLGAKRDCGIITYVDRLNERWYFYGT